MATWAGVDDVKRALGLTPADTFDDAWLAQVVDAANAWATRRRVAAGYDDPPGGPVLVDAGTWTLAAGDPNTTNPAPATFLVDDPAAVTRAAFAFTDANGAAHDLSGVAPGWTVQLLDASNPASRSTWVVAGGVAVGFDTVAFDVAGVDVDTPAQAFDGDHVASWYAPDAMLTGDPDVAQGVVYLAVWAYRTRGTSGDRAAAFDGFGGWVAMSGDQRRLVMEFLGIPRPVAV